MNSNNSGVEVIRYNCSELHRREDSFFNVPLLQFVSEICNLKSYRNYIAQPPKRKKGYMDNTRYNPKFFMKGS